ncbi:MAG: GGDEF domain-containing protein [Nocardiaceae bacterium]|nr:GGDEF domain-containing protein [Nocardiaceae bacterium]
MAADSLSIVWAAVGAGLVVFAGLAVFWAWSLDKRRRYLLLMFGGAMTYAVGLAVAFGDFLPGAALNEVVAGFCMIAGAILSMEAFARRTGSTLGRGLVLGVIVVAVAGEVWFSVLRPDAVARVRVEDYVTAAVSIRAVTRGRLLSNGRRGDPVLFFFLIGLAIWCLSRTWIGVSSAALAAGARFGTDIFVTPVYVIFAVLLVPATVTTVWQEVAGVIDVLRHERDTDQLTGVLNRRGFLAEAQRMVDDPRLAPVAMIVCDVDRFKQINDRYGHRAGDQVLQGFGRLLRESARNIDLVGRLGGEEFAILLATSEGGDGFEFAERVRIRLSSEAFDFLPATQRVTASFGVAGAGTGVLDLETLLHEADRRMYRAKDAGRDRSWPAY